MDIDGMHTFVTVAALGSFVRAAARLHRSQPAISRRIGLLEQELGAPLLERTRGGVQLTQVGRAFQPFAESALAAVQDGRAAARAAAGVGPDVLSVALVGTLADTWIVDVLKRHARRPKHVRLELRTANSREVSELVRRGEATIGLRYQIDDAPDLCSRVVAHERQLIVVAPTHRLGRVRPRHSVELRGEPWVGFPTSRAQPDSGRVLTRLLTSVGLDDAEVMAIDSLTAQKRLVEAGFGIGLLPESAVREELARGSLRRLRIDDMQVDVPVAAIYRRKGYSGSAAQSLLCEFEKRADALEKRADALEKRADALARRVRSARGRPLRA